MTTILKMIASLDAGSAQVVVDKLTGRVDELSHNIGSMTAGIDDKSAEAKLIRMGLSTDKLRSRLSMDLTLNGTASAAAKVLELEAEFDKLQEKAKINVKVNTATGIRGLLNKLPGIGGIGGGGASTAAGAGSSGGQAASSGGGLIFSNPYTATAAITAGLAALPFAAQAAAGGIVAALGGGLAAIGLYGASKLHGMAATFKAFSTDASSDLKAIGGPFKTVLFDLVDNAINVLGKLTPVFAGASKIIAGPFKTFGTALENAFTAPGVAKSIDAVATAFGKILKALTPTLAGDAGALATGITNVAKAVSENPNGIADFVSDLFKIGGAALDIISSLTRVANWIEAHWNVIKWIVTPVTAAVGEVIAHWGTLRHGTATIFDAVRHDVAHYWDLIYSDSIGRVVKLITDVHKDVAGFRHDTAGVFDSLRHDLSSIWDGIWGDTVGRVKSGISDVIGWFRGVPGRVTGALLGLGTKLYNLAHGWLVSLGNGARAAWDGVLHWIEGLPASILHALGIHSPPDWAVAAGTHIMGGILKGLHLGHGNVLQFVAGLAGPIGKLAEGLLHPISKILHGGVPFSGPVSGIAALGKAMAAQRGWTGTQWDALNAVEMAEAGWNPRAQNPSSGAYGIAQFINGPGEYAQYGGNSSTAAGQITGFLNYVAQRYGNPVAAWQHEQAYHWYGSGLKGGLFTQPTLIGVGERGPERVDVTPLGGDGSSAAGSMASLAARPGPLVNVEGNLVVQEKADAALMASKLSYKVRAAWSG